ncbi:hypothetical protein VD0002_g238 [Verticillium dahliae]|nr:hypothetical protein VdG1_00595 [Verticillium dahliae VDG1]PNH27969.1 hypothetical protein BJF96_g8743 [Verticillium dahliae]PNH41965.1 hypothetical protein VD0004_g5228 [Verticillium dahliae]PNH51997.1 hypothetical protein VD0003_g5295 [Verticillium dahliae]PNH70411.1 hypothetical protein VD0002_g238 [Verticillium dahliae]
MDSSVASTPRGLPRPYDATFSAATPSLRLRARSDEPPSSHRAFRTPKQPRRDYLDSSTHKGYSASTRKNNAPTPHARAASQYLDQRRAAMTPGRRRQSVGVRRRESLFDNLRALSQALAPRSKPVETSSSPRDVPSRSRRSTRAAQDDDDDELPIDRPEMTLPLDMDDDSDLVPPRSSILEDPTLELPRRAYSEAPSRLSLASRRLSEFYNVRDTLSDEDAPGQGFFPSMDADEGMDDEGAVDATLERIDEERRETLGGRPSDFGFAIPQDADPDASTFIMGLGPQSSPTRPVDVAPDEIEVDLGPVMEEDPSALMEATFDALASDANQPDPFGEASGDETLNEELPDAEVTAHSEIDSKQRKPRAGKAGWKRSKHGHSYPPFPSTVVKRVAEQFARTSGISNPRIGKDTLAALQQATDWFFEQVSEDLGAYAAHAGRRTINESDMELVMKRQRQVNETTSTFSLATQYLPAELVHEIRMPLPVTPKKRRRTGRDEEQDEAEVA